MTSLTWWFILFIVSILLELSSPGFFFFLSLASGAVVASAVSLTSAGLTAEFVSFILTSLIACYVLMRYVRSTSKDTLHSSNVYGLVGKQGVVTETIAPCHKGWVKVEGELWAALSKDETIHAGMVVVVLSTAGSHVIVKKIKDHC